MKSGLLYSHAEAKFKEFYSVGTIFNKLASLTKTFSEDIGKVLTQYKPVENEKSSTRGEGIKAILTYMNQISQHIKTLSGKIETIGKTIVEKSYAYDSIKNFIELCDEHYKNYNEELSKLKAKKEKYFEVVNQCIEAFVINKLKGKKKSVNPKLVSEVDKKKAEYKEQIDIVEKIRVEYMNIQGNIFAYEEQFEKECTNEMKKYLNDFIKAMSELKNNLIKTEPNIEAVNQINGEKDSNNFADENKSLMTGLKRNLYKEYSQDLNYYMEHFDCLKKELKNKSQNEVREFQKKISQEITLLLNDIIKEEPNEIHNKILGISKKLKESKLNEMDYQYLINKFQERFDKYLDWKKKVVDGQDFKKVGEEWDERFCYMHTFLGYFNKTRVESKQLDEKNFNYLCNAMKKILELNENEDIDYSLCDLVVILSSTFFMNDPNKKDKKIYVNEVIRNTSIMQRQRFWVGLTRFELNEEIQQRKKEEDTLKEDNISEEKLNNSIVAKLMSVSFNILQFVTDSSTFNKIIIDIFKYCKINPENREIIVNMMEAQIESENSTHIKLNKEEILSQT